MYTVTDYNGDQRVIKRLSRYEKRVLEVLAEHEQMGGVCYSPLPDRYPYTCIIPSNKSAYRIGRRVPVAMIKKDAEIKHRASLSRILKTLEGKGLIYKKNNVMSDNFHFSGVYGKYYCLSLEGGQVVKILKSRTQKTQRPA
jgi:hypothetical protein